MFKKVILKFIGVIFASCFVITLQNVDFKTIYSLNENTPITLSNLEQLNENNLLGDFVETKLTEDIWTTGGVKEKKTSLVIKLFGFIPIKKTTVVVCDDKSVYLGGVPLGFSVTTKGVIVVGTNSVVSNSKQKNNSKLTSGDIVTKINGVDIFDVEDIKKQLNDSNGQDVIVTYIRDDKEQTTTLTPILDSQTNEYKLGIWIRNDAQGIGTLTFVTEENEFGALGHSITDFETGVEIPVNDGNIYPCTMLGITKGTKGKAGELRCLFVQGSMSNGDIEKNTSCGVFGEITNDENIVDKNLSCPIASRLLVRVGKAKIISSVSGIREEYDIEIIKTYNQHSSSDKSFIFRVKDKRLIDLTGGIVQGMSGSPIVQDGKLIGAVTHVFLYDPTKGYGVYSDWMLNEVSWRIFDFFVNNYIIWNQKESQGIYIL